MILLTLSELETALEEQRMYFLKQTHIVLQIAGMVSSRCPSGHGNLTLQSPLLGAGGGPPSTFIPPIFERHLSTQAHSHTFPLLCSPIITFRHFILYDHKMEHKIG